MKRARDANPNPNLLSNPSPSPNPIPNPNPNLTLTLTLTRRAEATQPHCLAQRARAICGRRAAAVAAPRWRGGHAARRERPDAARTRALWGLRRGGRGDDTAGRPRRRRVQRAVITFTPSNTARRAARSFISNYSVPVCSQQLRLYFFYILLVAFFFIITNTLTLRLYPKQPRRGR